MKLIENYQKAVQNIVDIMVNYLKKNRLATMVLGVSGGIDSALTAALAFQVKIRTGIPLVARSLTIETNKPDEIERARKVGNAFANDFKEVDLTEPYKKVLPYLIEDYSTSTNDIARKIRRGNIKARMRMIYLYDLAAKNKGLVLSTDNYTEYLLGFWTLHGDVGDLAPIQQLWKTEVYQMAKFIADNLSNREQKEALYLCINAIPTDGLGITNSDLEQLKANSYQQVDKLLMKYLETKDKTIENHPVIQRYLATDFKRNNPFNITREQIL